MPKGSWWLVWPWIFIPYFGALGFVATILLVVRGDLITRDFARDRLSELLSVSG